MKYLQKGAMFGLDARIALAIFGALSVISGAALYSAIQDAKVTATVTELDEFAKAYQSYVLDTGLELEFRANPTVSDIALKTVELIESTKSGWKGPYLPFSTDDMNPLNIEHTIMSEKHGNIFFIRSLADNSFGSHTNNAGSQSTCVGNSTKCSIWVGFSDVYSEAIAKAIDIKVDGSDSPDSGKLRFRLYGGTRYAVYYEIMPSLEED